MSRPDRPVTHLAARLRGQMTRLTPRWSRRVAGTRSGTGRRLLSRRILPAVVTVAVVVTTLAALVVRPAADPPQATVDHVVVVGVAGLHWADVDPTNTPNLWRLAEQGSIGSLSVRSARQPTCPLDGWLTLGAGNYAAWDGREEGECAPLAVVIEPDGGGADLPELQSVALHNREKLTWGAVPGALAESVRCTVAIGPGAAVAAARPFGRVDRYAPDLPADPAGLLASCVLSIVDLGVIEGADPDTRADAARQADEALARVLAARPQRSLVLVAGVADTEQSSRLGVVIADGTEWRGGWLTSASTRRAGYVQLVDLAPTALTALGRSVPERLFAGQAATVAPGRPQDPLVAINQPADADREARAQRRVATWFFGLLAGLGVLLAVAVVPVLRRARPRAGNGTTCSRGERAVAVAQVLLIAAALAIPVAMLVDAVPWWRSDHGGLIFAGLTVLALALATTAVRFAPPYRTSLGPMAMVAGFTTLVVGVDVLTGARLQLNGVAGYSAIEDARYAGLGTVGLGVFIAGLMLSAGCLAQRVARPWRPVVLVLVGGVGVVLVGSPYLGADPVGAIALTAGVSAAAAIGAGRWLTFPRLTWAALAGFAVIAGVVALELRRPVAERSGTGRFLSDLADGASGLTIHRTSMANVNALLGSPLPVLAIVGAALVWFVLLRPWGGLKRLFGLYPAVRAAMAGIAVASVIGGLLGGTALDVAGAAAALAVPLAALAALRVLARSADRTFPRQGRTAPPGPMRVEPR